MSSSASGTPAGPPPNGYSICPLYDQTKPSKPSLAVTIKLQLCDAAGKNLSSAAVALTLQYTIGPTSSGKPVLPSSFRYDPSLNGYKADEPAGLAQGSYTLSFLASGDPAVHTVTFRIGSS